MVIPTNVPHSGHDFATTATASLAAQNPGARARHSVTTSAHRLTLIPHASPISCLSSIKTRTTLCQDSGMPHARMGKMMYFSGSGLKKNPLFLPTRICHSDGWTTVSHTTPTGIMTDPIITGDKKIVPRCGSSIRPQDHTHRCPGTMFCVILCVLSCVRCRSDEQTGVWLWHCLTSQNTHLHCKPLENCYCFE